MSNKHSSTKVESHGFLHDQKIRRVTGDIFAHLFLAILVMNIFGKSSTLRSVNSTL